MTTTVSKKTLAGAVFDQLMVKSMTRKAIIAEMKKAAFLTDNGAATYYTNFKSGVWLTTAPGSKHLNKDTQKIGKVSVTEVNKLLSTWGNIHNSEV